MFHLLLTFLSLMFSTSNPRSKASETSATAWCLGSGTSQSVKPTDSYLCIRNLGDTTKRPDTCANGAWPSQAVPFPETRCGTRVFRVGQWGPNFVAVSTKIPSFSGLRTFGMMLEFGSFSSSGESYRQHGRKIHLERIDVRKRMISWELFVGLLDKVDCSSINEMPFKNLQGNKDYLHRNRRLILI